MQGLLVEKYRPATIDDCILPKSLKETFKDLIKSGECQNLLLTGGAGCGKTSVARALCNELNADSIIINCSEDGNIDTDANGDGYGAIFDKGAIGILTSVAMNRERQRDASLRATELVITSDYSAFEIDDSRGASLFYDVANPATNA